MSRRRYRNRKGRSLVTKASECQCEDCKKQCYFPGFFVPNEVERVARFRRTSLQELFLACLCAELYSAPDFDQEVWLIRPSSKNEPTGVAVQSDHGVRRGTCVFFTESGLCEIHAVKPYVCRHSWHWQKVEDVPSITRHVVLAWNAPYAQRLVADLLADSMKKREARRHA